MNMKNILILVLILVSLTGCKKTVTLRDYNSISLPSIKQSLTTKDVEVAVLRGAVAKGWNTEKLKEGEILATLNVRAHQLVVLIEYDDKTFSVKYKDSTNLHYNRATNTIHRQYVNWTDNLISAIKTYSINQ